MSGFDRHPTGGDPRLLIGRSLVNPPRPGGSTQKGPLVAGRPRTRHLAATPVARYAILVFLLAGALVVTAAISLDRNARRSSWQEHTTALAGGARVGASSFDSLKANLSVQATQLATSLPLQRAVVTGNETELRRIAETRRARINIRGRTIGELAPTHGSRPRPGSPTASAYSRQ